MIIIATQLQALRLEELLPSSLKTDPKILAVSSALDPEFSAITEAVKHTGLLYRLDELDAHTLDLLAWQFHADFYDLTEPDNYASLRLKREAVKNSLLFHMRKGTVAAIMEGLRQLDISAEFIPWWKSGDAPYTFRLDAIVAGDFYKTSGKDILMKSIVRAVNEAKSARSYMSHLNVTITDDAQLNLTTAIVPAIFGDMPIRSMPPQDTDADLTHTIGIVPYIDGVIPVRNLPPQDSSQTLSLTHGMPLLREWDMQIPVHPPETEHTCLEVVAGIPVMQEGDIRIHTQPNDDIADTLPVTVGLPLVREWDMHIHTHPQSDIADSYSVIVGVPMVQEGNMCISFNHEEEIHDELAVSYNLAVMQEGDIRVRHTPPEDESANLPVCTDTVQGAFGSVQIPPQYPAELEDGILTVWDTVSMIECDMRVPASVSENETETGQAVIPIGLGYVAYGSATVNTGNEDISLPCELPYATIMMIEGEIVIEAELAA